MLFATKQLGLWAWNLKIIKFEMYILCISPAVWYNVNFVMFLLSILQPVRWFWLLVSYEGNSKTKIINVFFEIFMGIQTKNLKRFVAQTFITKGFSNWIENVLQLILKIISNQIDKNNSYIGMYIVQWHIEAHISKCRHLKQ